MAPSLVALFVLLAFAGCGKYYWAQCSAINTWPDGRLRAAERARQQRRPAFYVCLPDTVDPLMAVRRALPVPMAGADKG